MTIDLHLQHPNIMANCGSNAEKLHCRLQRITHFFVPFIAEEETVISIQYMQRLLSIFCKITIT